MEGMTPHGKCVFPACAKAATKVLNFSDYCAEHYERMDRLNREVEEFRRNHMSSDTQIALPTEVPFRVIETVFTAADGVTKQKRVYIEYDEEVELAHGSETKTIQQSPLTAGRPDSEGRKGTVDHAAITMEVPRMRTRKLPMSIHQPVVSAKIAQLVRMYEAVVKERDRALAELHEAEQAIVALKEAKGRKGKD